MKRKELDGFFWEIGGRKEAKKRQDEAYSVWGEQNEHLSTKRKKEKGWRENALKQRANEGKIETIFFRVWVFIQNIKKNRKGPSDKK